MESEVSKDVFISSHDGHIWGKRVLNSYQVFEDLDKNKYVRMSVFKNGQTLYTLFDFDDLNLVCNNTSWYALESGYVQGRPDMKGDIRYLHHHIMNFVGTGKGFQKVSIDHINRDPLDNRKQNLRLATCEEQQKNSKGQLEGTKRARSKNAKPLPEGIDELPKYVVYYTEKYGPDDKKVIRDFFRIEKHPAQMTDPPLFKNKWATSKRMLNYTIQEKLAEAKTKIQEMDHSLLGQTVNA
jgi:hypothetical protein